MIKTIIIDDEPSAVNVLTMLLEKKCSDLVEIAGTAVSPVEGKQLIEKLQPDLVILDIEMPGITGVDLVRSFTHPSFQVIFVTAYDAYAVEAFRLSAVDYLLKPVEAHELRQALLKIDENIRRNQHPIHAQLQKLEKLLEQHSGLSEQKIGIGMSDKIQFISISDIIYCEAGGAYTHIYLLPNNKITTSKLLGDFESQLAGHFFFRIHHHYLINLNHIREFQRHDGGYVIMENGQKLEVSQRKRKDFLQAISSFTL